ncbi:MAG: 1,2-phenylacetyl-CoA epoxidase subunit PaaD [Gemmatimonadota bacterium]
MMAVLDTVMDPEVPVLSVVELGIIREVDVRDDVVRVVVTPTYSGCPAMRVIEEDIEAALRSHGATKVEITTRHSPAWTTNWMPALAREKLRAYGIAPPGAAAQDVPVSIGRRRPAMRCPYCGSAATEMRSEFGSTACKAIHFCTACEQPFEEFKPI